MRKVFAFAILLAMVNLGLWWAWNRPAADIPDFQGRFAGAAWTPYALRGGPGAAPVHRPTEAELRADLVAISRVAQSIRTYSVEPRYADTGAPTHFDRLPELARDLPVTFMLGVWVSADQARNRAEIERVVELAAANRNVTHILVGSETVLRYAGWARAPHLQRGPATDLSAREVLAFLREVRRRTGLPVSTSETLEVWCNIRITSRREWSENRGLEENCPEPRDGDVDLSSPELAAEADFIAVHILPYWQTLDGRSLLEQAIHEVNRVRAIFPNRPVVVTEIGHPTGGRSRPESAPSIVEQARLLRGFANYARANDIGYYIMEAIDQPWKTTIEGSVGPYWGYLDGNREPKYALTGPVWERPNWVWLALAASLVALPLMIALGARRRGIHPLAIFALLALTQAMVSTAVFFADVSAHQYIFGIAWLPWAFLLLMLAGLALVFFAEWSELIDVMGRTLTRVYDAAPFARDRQAPKVSIHLPIHNEPPAVVIETLESLAALDWPDFEVIVVDNNTKDERVWRPVEAHCAVLNARFPGRFLFFHVDPLKGFKAGALNFALQRTDPKATIIGVIDADYVVDPQWLRRAVPGFDARDVGFVQCPQDHRDIELNAFKRMIGWEYAGFFHTGMVQRNERNALIQHGTMVLLRRAAMGEGWATWCIVEDAEMGLRLARDGWRSVYIRDTLGRGLMPDHFGAYKTQRFRWAYGAVQILRRYWRDLLLPGKLNFAQRYHFIAGWASWFADAGGLIFAWGAIFWTLAALPLFDHWASAIHWLERETAWDLTISPAVAAAIRWFAAWTGWSSLPNILGGLAGIFRTSDYIVLPHVEFLVPVILAFALRFIQVFVLYRLRVACTRGEMLMAAIAGLGLSYTVGRAILTGIRTNKRPFVRTPKADGRPALTQAFITARGEAILAALLWCAAGATTWNWWGAEPDAYWWAATMVVQSLPYVAAVVASLVAARAGGKTKAPAPSGHVQPAAGD